MVKSIVLGIKIALFDLTSVLYRVFMLRHWILYFHVLQDFLFSYYDNLLYISLYASLIFICAPFHVKISFLLALQVVITKCFHLFCNPCVQDILKSQHRKCPRCSATFGPNDVKQVFFWLETGAYIPLDKTYLNCLRCTFHGHLVDARIDMEIHTG